MPWVRTDAGVVHVRTSKKLHLCQCRRFATLECDWPREHTADCAKWDDEGLYLMPSRSCSCGTGDEKKTCDKPLCTTCARHEDPDVDYCPFHRGKPQLWQAEAVDAGELEAQNAAKLLGVKR